MSNLITNVNAEIANTQLEEKVTNIRKEMHSTLKMLKADWRHLRGKTIKESHTDCDRFMVLFTDGTYIVVATESEYSLTSEIMAISEGFECGLLSDDEHQTLMIAEADTACVRDEKEGVTLLNNAIAHLGIDAVKTLVDNV
jgi:hypothetical protein